MSFFAKLMLVLFLTAPAALAADSQIVGTWRGRMHDLPSVELTVKHDGGKLSGTILFYFLHRNSENESWQVDTAHSKPLPLIDPRFDGETLTFRVSIKEAHPPWTLNAPPSSFQMRLDGMGVGELVNLTEKHGPARKMIRDGK